MFAVKYDVQKSYWEGTGKRRTPDHPVVSAFAAGKSTVLCSALPEASQRMHMLEIGAGNGFFSKSLAANFDVHCLDFSERMLQLHPFEADRKTVGNAEVLPFADNSFDVTFCGNLLHHLESPVAAVKEMARVASRHVVIIEPNAANPLMFLFGAVVPEERGTLRFTSGFMRQLAEEAGLKLRQLVTHGTILPNKTPTAVLPIFKSLDLAWPLGFYHVAVLDT